MCIECVYMCVFGQEQAGCRRADVARGGACNSDTIKGEIFELCAC